MKKILFFLMTLSLILSCEDEQDFTNTTFSFASFDKDNYNLTVTLGSSSTQSISVAASIASSSERVHAIQVDTDASNITPSSYTIPNSITIPANQTTGSFDIIVTDDLELSGETLVLNLIDDDFTVQPATVNVKLFCPQQPPASGTWTIRMRDSYGDGWNVAAVTIMVDGVSTDYSVPQSAGKDTVEDTFDVIAGATEISVVFNSNGERWTDEVSYEVLTPAGDIVLEVAYSDQNISTIDETENFNYCVF
ncbi:DUF1735 domain-containing protein [Flavivirga rizhaonensis]|uniref:DUF1735 domain-containing protein n=1 Tax=Flavivirga rizhaonensis TaxID=2559571 RepID=A0A4S1DSM6_9FLAO|nr:DUF1735 domain-containing protein [Flavivirga rizhaonensis]TGV00957.1 DUF1735 domain-containing protein [Flavivirga rizhaonensis]